MFKVNRIRLNKGSRCGNKEIEGNVLIIQTAKKKESKRLSVVTFVINKINRQN